MKQRIQCIAAAGLAALLPCMALAGCSGSAVSEAASVQSSTAVSETAASGAAGEVPSATGEIFAMDTYMTITAYGDRCEEAVAAAEAEIQRLDELLSVGNENSEISIINANGTGTVSADTAAMIEKALELYDSTDGAFDITVYPLMELWGFTTGEFAVPDEDELQTLLANVDSTRVQYDENTGTVTIGEGQGIDLGGIAKGFTSDRIMEIFAGYDLTAGLVSLGGNVQFYGTKVEGNLWRCGIQDPNNPDTGDLMSIVQTDAKAVITSGAYERYFVDEETGKTYHHILDPSTGISADSGLTSVTVVSRQGMLADGLSTSCYVMGLEKAADYWREYGSDFDLVLMTEDNEIYVTEPLAEDLQCYYPAHVITQDGIEEWEN